MNSAAPASDPDPGQHLLVAIEQIKDYAIFAIDLDGRATTWNQGVARVLGYAEADFVGRDVGSAIFTPEALDDCVPQRELEEAARAGQVNNDRWMRRSNGDAFYAAGITTAVRDARGELVGFVKVMRDQTQWKQLQERLQQAVEALAEADRQRTAFIAMLGHELRNPLAPLRNAVHLLPQVAGDPQQLQGLAEMMERQVAQMGRLIDDLLDVSRVTQGKIELRREAVELNAIVRNAVDVALAQCKPLRHQLTVTPSLQPVYLNADAARLTQVVVNLLSNACKFTPPGGRIWVSAGREIGEAVLRVHDTGIGLEAHERGRIFEMFTQVDSSVERRQGGLGIGLALVRRVIELHGGSVHVESAGRGQGSEFIVRLPITRRDGPPPAAAPAAPVHTVRRRVLVVDDNEDAARSLAAVLQLKGHEAMLAHDGATAVRLALDERPDAVVLDIGLPVMSGLEVARRIRREQGAHAPFLIALTGWGQEEDRSRSAQAGFDAHLVKPVDPQALERLLGSLDQER
ncbi:ATP-binding protein [Caldimonas sp. KR1-144]|uniref:hybrid sensor histidine kinase/response regulator n=1 Tax=Caldimonas sp. KR1-144 TaxID=3400911 RepID=UPI003C074EA7